MSRISVDVMARDHGMSCPPSSSISARSMRKPPRIIASGPKFEELSVLPAHTGKTAGPRRTAASVIGRLPKSSERGALWARAHHFAWTGIVDSFAFRGPVVITQGSIPQPVTDAGKQLAGSPCDLAG